MRDFLQVRSRIVASLVLALTFHSHPGLNAQALCDSTSRGLIPLTELTGTYLGESGGLYHNGLNVPPMDHDSAGQAIAQTFVALDTLGQPDANGKWIFLSVGMSNCAQEFNSFIAAVQSDVDLHPNLRIFNGAQGGQTAAIIRHDTARFWDNIEHILRINGQTPIQVQAVWLKEADAGPNNPFPGHAITLRDELRDIVQVAKSKYPNLKQIFMSSRTYAGYASTPLNPEPYAYESGFSVRWLIESQINGLDSLNYDPDNGDVRAPWLAWGPYLYTDGIVPRQSDGLQWFCSDVSQTDGTHPSNAGRDKVAALLEDFLRNSPYTIPWFRNPTPPQCECDCHGNPQLYDEGPAKSDATLVPFCDGDHNISDVQRTIFNAFRGSAGQPDPNPNCTTQMTDVDCSGATDVLDVILMVNVSFRGANPATVFCNPCP